MVTSVTGGTPAAGGNVTYVTTSYIYDKLNNRTSDSRGSVSVVLPGSPASAKLEVQPQTWGVDSLGNRYAGNADSNTIGLYPAVYTGAPPQGNVASVNQASSGYTSGLVYDAWNRLVGVTTGGPGATKTTRNAWTFQYDAAGRLITTLHGGSTTNDYYDGQRLIQDGNDVYIWSPDGHLIQGKGLYVEYDAQGSTTALVNAAGKVTERFVYDENGQAFALGGSPRNPQSPLAQGATPKNWPFGYQQQRSMQFVSISGISSGGLSAARSYVSVALNMNAAGVWTNPVNGVHLSSLISTFSGAAQPPSMFSQVVMVAAPMVVGVTVAIVATPFLTPLGGAALGGLAGGLTAGLLGGMAAGDTGWQLAGDVAAGGAIGLIGGAVGGAVFELAAPLAGSILGSTGGGAAAGVVSGLAGDFAGQSLAIGMGVQNGYNYTQLAFSGFAGGAFGAYAGFRDPTLGGLLEAPSAEYMSSSGFQQALPSTGNAAFDCLAVETENYAAWKASVQARGISVNEVTLGIGTAAEWQSLDSLSVDPGQMRVIDLLHEEVHVQQNTRLIAAMESELQGNPYATYPGKYVTSIAERQAYQYELDLATQNGFSMEYVNFLEERLQYYSSRAITQQLRRGNEALLQLYRVIRGQ
jgi:YD repeat-containing protein